MAVQVRPLRSTRKTIVLTLQIVNKNHVGLREKMAVHYSAPKGFVGRSICYEVLWDEESYGFIVAGSATLHLVGRDKILFGVPLNNIVNNIFFHVEPHNGKYPIRSFTTKVVTIWRERIAQDWQAKYGDVVLGFETLIGMPRTGELYKRDGWTEVGVTKGFTCKRIAGQGSDSWTGKRVWDTKNLRPKRVFVMKMSGQPMRGVGVHVTNQN